MVGLVLAVVTTFAHSSFRGTASVWRPPLTPAARRVPTQTASASITTPGPTVLDVAPPLVARLSEYPVDRQGGHRGVLASPWLRLFWRLRSSSQPPGRPKVSEEMRQLIRRMKSENPSWGALRIHGELLLLGFQVSEATVSRYRQRLKRRTDGEKARRWMAFLNNHREVIAALDVFTVPTLTFRVLYCFFVIEDQRRHILRFNTTAHPTGDRIVQQFAGGVAIALPVPVSTIRPRCQVRLRVRGLLQASGIQAVRTSLRSPWQNGVAKRWVGSCRREMVNMSIRSMSDNCCGLAMSTLAITIRTECMNRPSTRLLESHPIAVAKVPALTRIGGLRHRYCWSAAA